MPRPVVLNRPMLRPFKEAKVADPFGASLAEAIEAAYLTNSERLSCVSRPGGKISVPAVPGSWIASQSTDTYLPSACLYGALPLRHGNSGSMKPAGQIRVPYSSQQFSFRRIYRAASQPRDVACLWHAWTLLSSTLSRSDTPEDPCGRISRARSRLRKLKRREQHAITVKV